MTAREARAEGLFGASTGRRNGPGGPAHSKPRHRPTPPGPVGRPWAAGHGFIVHIEL